MSDLPDWMRQSQHYLEIQAMSEKHAADDLGKRLENVEAKLHEILEILRRLAGEAGEGRGLGH